MTKSSRTPSTKRTPRREERVRETGIACGDGTAALAGETFAGTAIAGVDAIRTVGCR